MQFREAVEARDASEEAVRVVFQGLQNEALELLDVCEVLEAVCAWLRRSTWATQKLLASDKSHAVVVRALSKHGACTELARLACSLVALGCYRSVENAGPFCRAGVVPEILKAMERHNTDNVVMDIGCEALWRLGDRSGAPYIRDCGGVERLLDAMRVHRDNPFLQSNASSALYNLVEPNSPWLGRMCEEAHAAMAAHIGHSPIKRQAERLIQACEEAIAASDAAVSVAKTNPAPAQNFYDHSSAGRRLRAAEPSSLPAPPTELVSVAAQPQQQEQRSTEVASSPISDTAHAFREWLGVVDEEGFLLQYAESFERVFSSPSEVVGRYGQPNAGVDSRLFDDIGIRRIGHHRLFEVWFRDYAPQREV